MTMRLVRVVAALAAAFPFAAPPGTSASAASSPGSSSSSSSSSLSVTASEEWPPGPAPLEPTVARHVGILPPSVCEELIALGEAEGFDVDAESIDADEEGYDVSSQSIEVFERDDGVVSPAIWAVLEPWIPRLTDLVRASIDPDADALWYPDAPDRIPRLGWVFFRKYSPDAERKSLKLHVDSNMHTLNVALNDDFEGGGLFYAKPPGGQRAEDHFDNRPDVPDEFKSYEWLDGVRRENASNVVFPNLGVGDVLVHNFTVWHAVAPIERGTRYSFVLFYDMDNPAIQVDFERAEASTSEDVDDAIPASFYHTIGDLAIDLVYVEETDDGTEEVHPIEENVPPFEDVRLNTYEGHVFRALVSGTDVLVDEFVMREARERYRITRREEPRGEL